MHAADSVLNEPIEVCKTVCIRNSTLSSMESSLTEATHLRAGVRRKAGRAELLGLSNLLWHSVASWGMCGQDDTMLTSVWIIVSVSKRVLG